MCDPEQRNNPAEPRNNLGQLKREKNEMAGVLLVIVPVVMIILPKDKSKLFYFSTFH